MIDNAPCASDQRALQRSVLVVPGSNPSLFHKAAASPADGIVLDLEDAVSPELKGQAREYVAIALEKVNWGNKCIAVRINGLETPYMFRDIIEIVGNCPRLDALVIPKVEKAEDIYAVDTLATQISWEKGRSQRLGLGALIETARGVSNVETIASYGPNLETIIFGAIDYTASVQARETLHGGEPGMHTWHYPRNRILTACRAHGVRPIDGPYTDLTNRAGLEAAARYTASLGYDGKWVIHPSQIESANVIFSPTTDDILEAEKILKALEEAGRAGKGVIQIDGKMIDAAHIRNAQRIVHKAETIEKTQGRR